MSKENISPSTSPTGRTFVWHECYTPDVQKAIDFYTEALDFGTQDIPMGPMGTRRMLTRHGQPVAGLVSTRDPKLQHMPPHWTTYLSVDNVDSRIEKCTKLGAKVVVPAMDIPNVGRMALIEDPQGAHIWLLQESQR